MLDDSILYFGVKPYLDPGSGSFLFQTLLAVGLGSLITLKLYWNKIVSFLKKRKQPNENDQEEPETK